MKKNRQSQARDPRAAKAHPAEAKSSGHWLAALGLLVITLAAFWPVGGHGFLNYDDTVYVTENRQVQRGLNAENVHWAFHTFDAANWHPLTWLSHMTDVTWFGLNPAGHHWMNLAFHIANVLLLFGLLFRLTKALWPSALVAALFGVHPTRVESVAWVAERKDVLSTLFGLLAIWAYVSFVERHSTQRARPSAILSLRSPLVLILYAASLMAKPMLVTLPVLLLLLDYWPLKRMGDARTRFGCVIEKVPLFLLAAASSAMTFAAQTSGGAVGALEEFPLHQRLANAVVSYGAYIFKALWPSHLAIFYPYPMDGIPAWQIAGAAVLLIAVTVWIVRMARVRPYLAVGWLWYLISLTPVIGVIQVGGQAMADRYTYVPFVGLFVAIVWGVLDVVGLLPEPAQNRNHSREFAFMLAASALIVALAFATRMQVGYWKDSITVFSHALEVTGRNYVAEGNLGQALWAAGRTEESIEHFRKSVDIMPNSEVSRNVLGGALLTQRHFDEAASELSKAIALKPDYAPALFNLGLALMEQGRTEEAIERFRETLAITPESFKAHANLAAALARSGNKDEAMQHYQQALAINPDDSGTRNNFGNLLAGMGRLEDALAQFRLALERAPGDHLIHYNVGVISERLGRNDEAIAEFETVLRIMPDHAAARRKLDQLKSR